MKTKKPTRKSRLTRKAEKAGWKFAGWSKDQTTIKKAECRKDRLTGVILIRYTFTDGRRLFQPVMATAKSLQAILRESKRDFTS